MENNFNSMNATNSVADRLEQSIKMYVASHQKKNKYVFLAGHNLDTSILPIMSRYKFAHIGADEKVLMVLNKIIPFLYPILHSVVITNKFLYYRLGSDKYIISPMFLQLKKKRGGVIPLEKIETLDIGEDVGTLGGDYFGSEFIVNGKVLGLIQLADYVTGNPKEELNQIFKAAQL